MDGMKDRLGITIYSLESWYFDDEVCRKKLLEHFEVSSFAGLGLADYDCGIISAGALLQYLLETTEKLALQSDTYYALCRRQVYDDRQFDKKKS